MSKAFTKDEGAGSEPALRPRRQQTAGERRYITAEGYRALQEQLERHDSSRLAAATDSGADLEALRRERERSRGDLVDLLESVQVSPPPADLDHVYFGAWVVLEDEAGEESRYRLVGADEADVRAGRLSIDAPLARALLGKATGDSVTLQRPRGDTELTLLEVSYSPPSH